MPKKKAAAKDQAASGGNKKYEDYINAFEQRKKEQAARRFQLLFLKRLENDGQRILMSKQDRDLIRNFGKLEEEQAEKDLMKAINAD